MAHLCHIPAGHCYLVGVSMQTDRCHQAHSNYCILIVLSNRLVEATLSHIILQCYCNLIAFELPKCSADSD